MVSIIISIAAFCLGVYSLTLPLTPRRIPRFYFDPILNGEIPVKKDTLSRMIYKYHKRPERLKKKMKWWTGAFMDDVDLTYVIKSMKEKGLIDP